MDIKTANRLYELRKKKGLSQEALAEKLGISRQSVSKWERAESSPDTDNLIALAKLYGVSLDELLLGEGNTENSAQNESSQKNTDNDTDAFDSEEAYQEYVDEGYNFIKVDSEDGDKVRIGTRGIYVKDKHGDNVKVGFKGISVNGEKPNKDLFKHGHIFNDEIKNNSAVIKAFKAFPYPVLACITFFLCGFFIDGGWVWSWLCFLTIPLYYTLIEAIAKKKPSHFAYPVLAVIIFFVLGFSISGAWVWCWLVYLTIPIYYGIAGIFGKRKKQ